MSKPKPPRTVNIDLIIHQPTNTGFELKPTSAVVPVANNRLTFENNHHDGFIVNFRIDDRTGTGFVFPDDLKEAMWVRKISSEGDCPTATCHWSQFKAIEVDTTDNKTLTVRNWNRHLQYFAFALRVAKNPTDKPALTFDPIGDNRNGSSS